MSHELIHTHLWAPSAPHQTVPHAHSMRTHFRIILAVNTFYESRTYTHTFVSTFCPTSNRSTCTQYAHTFSYNVGCEHILWVTNLYTHICEHLLPHIKPVPHAHSMRTHLRIILAVNIFHESRTYWPWTHSMSHELISCEHILWVTNLHAHICV